MRHTLVCETCGATAVANGQRRVDAWTSQHGHSDLGRITHAHIRMDDPQDRIIARLDPPELVTHRPAR